MRYKRKSSSHRHDCCNVVRTLALRKDSLSPPPMMTMERNASRSLSCPPDLHSSSPSFSSATTVPAVGFEDDEQLLLPSPARIVMKDKKATPLENYPAITYSAPFFSPTPCPDSGGSSSLSASPFAFSSSAAASTFRRPSNGASPARTPCCPSRRSYYSPPAVCSRASRIVFEEVSARPITPLAQDDTICALPSSHDVQPSPATQSVCASYSRRNNQTSAIRSAHVAEYFSATGEHIDFTPSCQKPLLPRLSFPEFDLSTSQHVHPPDGANAGSADSVDLAVRRYAGNALPDLEALSTTAAQSSVRATNVSRECGIALDCRERASQAVTAERLCIHRAAEQQQWQKEGWQHQQRRREEQQHHQIEKQRRQQIRGEEQRQQQHWKEEHHQQRQPELDFQQQWRDQFHELRSAPEGLQQWHKQQQQQRSDKPQHLQEGCRQQQLYHRDTACDLIRKIAAGKQRPPTCSLLGKSAQIQLLQERLRTFCRGPSCNQATQQRDRTTTPPFLRPLSGANKCGDDFCQEKKGILPRPSCAESFLSAAASRQHAMSRPAYAAYATPVVERASHVPHQIQEQLRPQEQVQKRTKDVKTNDKTPWDRRFVFMFALLFLDVIIIGSTSMQHALNPASLIDKILLTHLSFSASLCALSAGTPVGTAECLASVASGNAAAAAAVSSVAAENTTKSERGLLVRQEGQQQVELPPFQLLREPYFLSHYGRGLPHSLKRELGLSCVCGWAALVVLGIVSLWVALRDRSLAARVFPAITASGFGRGSAYFLNANDEGRRLVSDSKSVSGCSRDGDESCSTPCTESWSSSRCSSPAQEKNNCASACNSHIEGCCLCGAAYHSSTCHAPGAASSSKRRSFSSACVCSNSSSTSNNCPLAGMSRRCSRVTDHHACCCRCREPGHKARNLGAAAAETAKGAFEGGRSRRKGLANAGRAKAKACLRDYEQSVLKEYQAQVVTEARARIFCLSLFALLIFFAMNFVVQLNVRCHRTKYQFYTVQSLAAASLREEAQPAGVGVMGRSSNIEKGGARREPPTTPNTPLPPLKLLLHAQQPAAASSAYYSGEGEKEEEEDDTWQQQQQQPQPEGDEGGETAGQQVEHRGRQHNKQEPPTSPSYVYYRDYLFWYQLFADFCRDPEMLLSVVWIVLHIAAVILCRSLMMKAEEHATTAVDSFRRRYRHSSKVHHSQ